MTRSAAVLLVILAAIAMSVPAGAQTTLRFGQIPSTVRSVSSLAMFIAERNGIFAQEQIIVEKVLIPGGTDKMVVWDDLDREEPLRIYDSGISVLSQEERDVIIPHYRIGDVHAPRIPAGEPLVGVVRHFQQVIALMAEAGALKAPLPPAERFVDLQYLRAAGLQ